MSLTRDVNMSQRGFWTDDPTRRSYLAQQLNDGAMCLVLGAGVSIQLGLPTWDQLITRLYAGNESSRPMNVDLKRQAEHFKNKLCGSNTEQFNKAVRDALYLNCETDFEILRRDDLLGAIGALAMSSVRGRASTVITFNFDDLLEHFLEYHGFVVNAIGDETFWTRSCDVEIYHPHGCIPHKLDGSRQISRTIVLDQREYSSLVGDESHPWRQRLLSAMRTKTCLFIGTSGLDDNLDSLVDKTQKTHAITNSSTAFWGVWITGHADEQQIAAWTSRGVFPLVLQGHARIPSELFAIAQEAAVSRQRL